MTRPPFLANYALATLALTVAWLVGQQSPVAAGLRGPEQGPTHPLSLLSSDAWTGPRSQPAPVPAAPSLPLTSAAEVPAVVRGEASWYCSDGRYYPLRSRCTAGHGPDELAVAVPWAWRHAFPEGTRLRVWSGGRHVDVTVVDVNVGASFDVTCRAFARLAWPGLGRIAVVVETLR